MELGNLWDFTEKVAEQDSVLHRVRTLRDLKKRLGEGRRRFALTHPSLPNDPIAFIHCALTPELAPSLPYLDETCREGLVPSHAMFYSVNAPHTALSGLDLATRIIKRAVQAVQEEFPTLTTFSTLSPVPSFMPCYRGQRLLPSPIEDKLRVTAAENGCAGWEVGSDGVVQHSPFCETSLSPNGTTTCPCGALRGPYLAGYVLLAQEAGLWDRWLTIRSCG